jgi:hypothetical protein
MCNCNSETSNGLEYVPGNGEYTVSDKIENLRKGIISNIKKEFVSNDEYLYRISKCLECGQRRNFFTGERNSDRVEKSDICSVCDCFLKVDLGFAKGKAWLKDQECPLGKWQK